MFLGLKKTKMLDSKSQVMKKLGVFVILPETNSSPLKIGHPHRKIVFQPSIFRGELLVSGRVSFFICVFFFPVFVG